MLGPFIRASWLGQIPACPLRLHVSVNQRRAIVHYRGGALADLGNQGGGITQHACHPPRAVLIAVNAELRGRWGAVRGIAVNVDERFDRHADRPASTLENAIFNLALLVAGCVPALLFVTVPFIVQRLVEGAADIEPLMEQGEDRGVLALRYARIGEGVAIGDHAAPASARRP